MRFLTVLFLIAGVAAAGEPQREPPLDEMFGRLPLYFVENRGQVASEVLYYLQGRNSVYFTSQGMTLALASENENRWAVAVDIVGARRDLKPEARDRTEAVVSYFKGPRPDWKTGLPTYGTVLYREAWPGIDLSWSGTAGRLEDTLVVRPGADPKRIRIRYRGATSVKLDQTGGLVVETPAGGFRVDRPLAYQEVDGKREEVPVRFALAKKGGNPVYGFRVGKYDRSRPLVIDPVVLLYCGYIGGDSIDYGYAVAVDDAGNAYVTGSTQSSEASFPVGIGPFLTYHGGGDVFVAKVNADGTALVYAGYIGGEHSERGTGIAVDGAGNAYVIGTTYSTEATFPVVGGPDLTYNGWTDAFVAKVNPDGTGLLYCGYIGGDDLDEGDGIAVDGAGNAYVTGSTLSTEVTFPVTVGPDLTFHDAGPLMSTDAFVAKIKADGTGFDFAGYIGGNGSDAGYGIAVDGAGNAYVTGYTSSTEMTFPVLEGPDLTYNGADDAFVAKVKADGTGLLYAGYVGGDDTDRGQGIAVDGAGCAYLCGNTSSGEGTFPVTIGPDLTYNGTGDAFVAKVKADGTGLLYAGYVGGQGLEYCRAIAVDSAGHAYVTGMTYSDEASFPVTGGPDLSFNGIFDAFVAEVDADGTELIYSGYIGGDRGEEGCGIAVDSDGKAIVVGSTASDETTFPVVIGPDLAFEGNVDAFVAKIGFPSCMDAAAPILQVRAVKEPTNPDNIDFTWLPDPAGNGYNIWYVTTKEEIPQARQSSSPPAVPVTGCSVPAPATATACTDQGAVSRDAPTGFFYQVRTYCDASNEGP